MWTVEKPPPCAREQKEDNERYCAHRVALVDADPRAAVLANAYEVLGGRCTV